MDRPEEAIASHNKGLAHLRELVGAMPAVTQYQADLAKGLNHLGKLLQAHGPPDQALTTYREAESTLKGMARMNPADDRFRPELARSLVGIAGLLRTTGDPAGALSSAQEALTSLKELPDASLDELPLLARATPSAACWSARTRPGVGPTPRRRCRPCGSSTRPSRGTSRPSSIIPTSPRSIHTPTSGRGCEARSRADRSG